MNTIEAPARGLYHGLLQVLAPGHTVRKRGKRLYVVDPAGREIYTPPDFVELQARSDFSRLLLDLDNGRREIDAIAAFETGFSKEIKVG